MIEEEDYFSQLPFEIQEEDPEEDPEEEEEELIKDFEGIEAWPGLSLKLSNSAFSVEVNIAGIMPNKSKLKEAETFLEDLLRIAKDYHLIE